jgi:hypothetical protein
MKKGYYTDNQGRCLGGWELNEKPQDTMEYKWFESDTVPEVYNPRTSEMVKAEISALEIKNLRKLYDGEDMTAVNAERMRLRSEIQKLEKPSAV